LGVALTARNRRTLAAAARAMIPPGGAVEAGADELGLPAKIAADVDSFPRVPHNLVRLLLFAVEHYPLVSGRRRRFTALAPDDQVEFLNELGHHERSALRRLSYSYLKSIVFGAFVSHPDVEKVIGYRYECLRPLAEGPPEEQVHH
jgi:hypothetical protein